MQRRVYHLAQRLGLDVAAALQLLREAGFSLPDARGQLPKHAVRRAEAVLQEYLMHGSPGMQPFFLPETGSSTNPAMIGSPASRLPEDKSARIVRLSVEEVLAIRRQMARKFIADRGAFGQPEPLWPDKLEMAVSRQFTSMGGVYKYKSIWQVGATLAYGLTLAHAFENGNKRTALVSMLVFLNKNKVLLANIAEDDLYQLMTSIAAHQLPLADGKQRSSDEEVASLASWLENNGRELALGDQALDFRELRKLLQAQGCEFDAPRGNYIKIHRDGRSVKSGYPRESFTVPVQEIKRIRKFLLLDEIHGFDSQGFYNLEGAVDEFVNTYRNLMRRLADL